MSDEIWKYIDGFPDYEVSNMGRIKSYKNEQERILKPSIDGTGYYNVKLRKNGKMYTKRVHQLVLKTFVGPCPEGMECCHNGGNHLNNRLENLRWDTHSSNQQDQRKHGTSPVGSKHPNSKLTETDVLEIRERRKNGETQDSIAKDYDVTRPLISYIVNNKTWRHVL